MSDATGFFRQMADQNTQSIERDQRIIEGMSRERSEDKREPTKEYPIRWCADIEPVLDTPMLVQGVLGLGAMSVVYGESNSGKTFFSLDLAMHIAAGREWNGHYVTDGVVLYFASEGGHSVINRVAANKDHVLMDPQIPFGVITTPIDLLDPDADAKPIAHKILEVEDAVGKKVRLASIDTLARAMPGNENSGEDMGALVRNGDYIRQQTNTHLQWVHHAGKDTAKGARGHSSLRAATDTEIEIVNNGGIRTATITKQRDLGALDAFAFRLLPVVLGQDPRGVEISTCIVESCDAPTGSRKKLTRQQQLALQILRDRLDETRQLPPSSVHQDTLKPGQYVLSVSDFRVACVNKGIAESDKPDTQQRVFRRVLQGLQVAQIIDVFEDWVWLRTNRTTGGQADLVRNPSRTDTDNTL